MTATGLHQSWLVHHYVERAARERPGHPAVCDENGSITYSELDKRANGVAVALKNAGIVRGSCVPVLINKSIDAIIAMIGTLKAGCAYVPVDCESPASRIAAIFDATKAVAVLTRPQDRSRYEVVEGPETRKMPELWIDISIIPGVEQLPFPQQAISVDLAYVLFTSGSTGTPKGVMIAHQAIIDYIEWCVHQYRIVADDQVANHAPLYFDNSTFDLYTAFSAGATLHLVPPSLNAVLPRLAGWIDERNISVFFCVPSVLTLLLKSRRLKPGNFSKLRELVFAGEVVQPDVLTEWMTMYPHVTFTNMYGPTEITVDCTYHVVESAPGTEPVPIGKARPNMELLVHCEDGSLSRNPGATGELWVRGLSVGYGYLGNPERTQAAFVQNPGTSFPDRLYRTGDLVRIREDGNFMFLGRADQQIKYLGHRIELGEIESQLQSIPEVEEAVVVFKDGEDAAEQGIGALVSVRGEVDAKDVLAALKHKVPAYMLPKRMLCTSHAFPRTPNGKYDRRAIMEEVFNRR